MIKLWSRWLFVHDINSVCEDLSLDFSSRSRLCKTFEDIQNLMWFILVCCTWHTGVYTRGNRFICGGDSVCSSRTNSKDHEKAILLGFGDDEPFYCSKFDNLFSKNNATNTQKMGESFMINPVMWKFQVFIKFFEGKKDGQNRNSDKTVSIVY